VNPDGIHDLTEKIEIFERIVINIEKQLDDNQSTMNNDRNTEYSITKLRHKVLSLIENIDKVLIKLNERRKNTKRIKTNSTPKDENAIVDQKQNNDKRSNEDEFLPIELLDKLLELLPTVSEQLKSLKLQLNGLNAQITIYENIAMNILNKNIEGNSEKI